ncbi:hypothetical protein B9P52_31915 [Achromobacter denitrificans]|uniref:hypothetical protein n=1 Tax=Achromobacter denitrificans TaxID=32002 RepID=UPI000B4CCE47|nr:hypothetical protein [Achromobacter denitrificans]ASC68604.1 hypothetical protein B9P52_31915 [Achromobacter denitrificans]
MTDTVQCVYCERFTLRHPHTAMAAQGLGRCTSMTDRPGTFVSPLWRRNCGNFQPAPAAKAEARIEWLRDLRGEGV